MRGRQKSDKSLALRLKTAHPLHSKVDQSLTQEPTVPAGRSRLAETPKGRRPASSKAIQVFVEDATPT